MIDAILLNLNWIERFILERIVTSNTMELANLPSNFLPPRYLQLIIHIRHTLDPPLSKP